MMNLLLLEVHLLSECFDVGVWFRLMIFFFSKENKIHVGRERERVERGERSRRKRQKITESLRVHTRVSYLNNLFPGPLSGPRTSQCLLAHYIHHIHPWVSPTECCFMKESKNKETIILNKTITPKHSSRKRWHRKASNASGNIFIVSNFPGPLSGPSTLHYRPYDAHSPASLIFPKWMTFSPFN